LNRSAYARGKLTFGLLLLCSFLFWRAMTACPAPAQTASEGNRAIVQRIEFVGNRRIARDTLLARIFSRPGDIYSPEAARRDFQALWNTQYFEDVRLEVENSPDKPGEVILVYYVRERPIIRRIEYKGNKSISESDILDRYKDRKLGLTQESQFDPTKVKRAEVILKELLAEHGRQFASVKATYERIPASNAVKLTFVIDEGPKVKVGRITITGNHAFSQRRIIRAMKNDRPYAIPLGITYLNVWSKTFDRDKLSEDLEVGIRGLYQDNGYFKVLVKDPILTTVDVKSAGLPGPIPWVGRKPGKATNIVIPIEEGDRYRMGTLTIRSSDPDTPLFFKTDFLKKAFPLKEGQIFSADKIRKALKDYQKLYGEFGYVDFVAQPLTDVDDTKKIVNLTMEFDQQKQFFIRRIEFTGNTTTRDKVIRRQLLLDEGQIFNNRLWELSLLRLNQLDYFNPIKPENAELKRNPQQGTVDITLKVKEKGKQSISLTGGVSGLAGTFVGATYQTNNFLGLGETLSLSASLGDRQNNVLFGFTEPYLFDRPISTGFTVFMSKFDYNQQREESILAGQQLTINPAFAQNYDQDQKGFTLFASYPLKKLAFTRVGVTYAYTDSSISAFSTSSQLLFEALQFQALSGPSALNGIHSSKITPTITYNTVNNPVNPTGGKSFFYGLGVEGGILGGNTNVISNSFDFKYFHPINHRRNVIGFHLLTAFSTGYNGTVIPPFSRFYLGGENDIRGFDYFTISPWVYIPTTVNSTIFYQNPSVLNGSGQPTTQSITVPVLQFAGSRPGGDTELVSNLEYRIPIAGPVSMSLFTDLGMDSILRPSQLQLGPQAAGLLQKEFPNPDFPNTNVPTQLQIANGTNFTPRVSTGVQLVVRLPIVNAPFRFYWAYNPLRLTETITQPAGAYYLSPEQKAALPPGVLQTQIIPQLNNVIASQTLRIPTGLFEPSNTFRFSVSTTF
jgi:outer membrane protein insertion porin family